MCRGAKIVFEAGPIRRNTFPRLVFQCDIKALKVMVVYYPSAPGASVGLHGCHTFFGGVFWTLRCIVSVLAHLYSTLKTKSDSASGRRTPTPPTYLPPPQRLSLSQSVCDCLCLWCLSVCLCVCVSVCLCVQYPWARRPTCTSPDTTLRLSSSTGPPWRTPGRS